MLVAAPASIGDGFTATSADSPGDRVGVRRSINWLNLLHLQIHDSRIFQIQSVNIGLTKRTLPLVPLLLLTADCLTAHGQVIGGAAAPATLERV
jgi:hypothetical protein